MEHDATSYVGWFDLGFVENALGNVDASIAAYRKSVAAKPDVFESNLNLGLQLAKTGQPDAEEFLRAATHLKPTSHVEEGQYRAWLALGQTLEKTKPEEALGALRKAAEFQPKEAEPHFAAGMLLEQEDKFADAEQEYQRALELDPFNSLIDHFDHVIKVAGIDHVGIGTDFDGIPVPPEGIDSAADLPKVTAALMARGYTAEDMHKLLGGNLLRVFREVQAAADKSK